MLIVFCVERPSEEGLLNIEGILTLPTFLLCDGSLMQM